MAFNTKKQRKNEWTKFLKKESAEERARIKLPAAFDGRNVWKNLISKPLDQGQCNACWAFASASALGDRFNIQSMGAVHLTLSPTRLVLCASSVCDKDKDGEFESPFIDPFIYDCPDETIAGCSQGSTLLEACNFLFLFGTFENQCLPADRDLIVNWPSEAEKNRNSTDESTSPLIFEDGRYKYPALYKNVKESISCKSVVGPYGDQCDNDDPTATSKQITQPDQHIDERGVTNTRHARHWRALAFYTFSGIEDVKYDIYRWGTVCTSMEITQQFLDWTRSDASSSTVVYKRKDTENVIGHHSVCLVGWGVDKDNDPYWIVKNSWKQLPYFLYGMNSNKSLATECVGIVPDFFVPLAGIRNKPNVPSSLIQLRKRIDDPDSGIADPLQTIDSSNGFTRAALKEMPELYAPPFQPCELPYSWSTFVAGTLPSSRMMLWLYRHVKCSDRYLPFIPVVVAIIALIIIVKTILKRRK